MSISNPYEQQLLLAGYILGDLDLEESLAFEQMLANDLTLQQELAQLQLCVQETYGLEETPPPALKASVMVQAAQRLAHSKSAGVSASASASQVVVEPPAILSSSSPSVLSIPKRILWLVSGLLVALSLYLGLQNYGLRQQLQAQPNSPVNSEQDDQADAATYSLAATGDATAAVQDSAVELVVNTDRTAATLRVQDLPTLPTDRTYVLWTVVTEGTIATTDSKNAILTTVFDVNGQGDQVQDILLPSVFQDSAQVEKIAVTIEKADAPQDHIASPILAAPL